MSFKWRFCTLLLFKRYSKACSMYQRFSKLPSSFKIAVAPQQNQMYHTHSSQRILTKESKPFDLSYLDEAKAKANKEYTLKSIRYSLLGLGMSIVGVGSYVLMAYGRPQLDENGNEIKDEFSDLPKWKQYIYRGVREIENFTLFIQQPSRDKLLPDPLKFPYQQPKYTLILELTNVLIYPDWTYNTGWRFKKRPGLNYFLESLEGMYEIVIFTAELGATVIPLVEALDTKNIIRYKLVRDATHFVDGHHVKNLDKLNRDLSKVIVIDWNSESVKFHNDNLLNIGKWNGNDDDITLIDLTSFLATIAQSEVEDVREVLRYYKTFDNPLATFRQKQKEVFEEKEDVTVVNPSAPRKSYFY